MTNNTTASRLRRESPQRSLRTIIPNSMECPRVMAQRDGGWDILEIQKAESSILKAEKLQSNYSFILAWLQKGAKIV